jgi:hypothetical protein
MIIDLDSGIKLHCPKCGGINLKVNHNRLICWDCDPPRGIMESHKGQDCPYEPITCQESDGCRECMIGKSNH